jgi:CheY-like chemotaxis protein
MFVGFVLLDALVRQWARKHAEAKERAEREQILATAIRLDFALEAKSLKRVEVPQSKGRILAVDDETVILDSFRKILVLAGYDIDTVESGPEALGLVQKRDYDFVFTDLKMPDMDGIEVVKAVKHLRPDVDVAVITGYGTIESAVETMQFGAVDYVQKPFTEDELTAFVKKLSVKREARLAALRKPKVSITAAALADAADAHEYSVPGGVFLSSGHVWIRLETSGQVRVGLDDFARKAIGVIDSVELPVRNTRVLRGSALFSVKRGGQEVRFRAPLEGQIVHVNESLERDPRTLTDSPYEQGWTCLIQPDDLALELKAWRIGVPVVDWYQAEVERLREKLGAELPIKDLAAFEEHFIKSSA